MAFLIEGRYLLAMGFYHAGSYVDVANYNKIANNLTRFEEY